MNQAVPAQNMTPPTRPRHHQMDETCVLSSADTLRRALQFPGMKFCLKEFFNHEKATLLMNSGPGMMSEDHRKKLARFLKHARKDPETRRWFVEAKYDFSVKKNPVCKEQGIGRIYGDVTLGTLPCDIRNFIADDCDDWDIANSHPTMLLLECQSAGLAEHAKRLEQYVENRDGVLHQLGEDYDLHSYADRKQAVVKVLNGGSPPKYANDGKGAFFLHHLAAEVKQLSALLMAKPEYAKEAAAAKQLKGKATFLHYLMCSKELELLVEIAACIMKKTRRVNSLIYDGLLVAQQHASETPAQKEALRKEVEAEVREASGCWFDLKLKPMTSVYTEQLAAQQEELVVDDDYAAGRFVSLYGRDNFRLVHGEIHVFDKETGMWGCEPYMLSRAVHLHKKDLMFQTQKVLLNYGGDITKVEKMLKMVPNHIAVDETFYIKNLDSSLGKLLFQNGIYDFDNDKFTIGFDPKLVFRGRIDRKFDRHTESDIKTRVLQVLWKDPYTKEQLAEGVPRCEQIALARALWGDYRARKMYFMVGDTSTGKGLLEEAMQMACGSFVGTFDVASFVRNTNSGADAAKQLSWLKMIADLRIAFSSEAHRGSTLCGVLVKKVVSGGDRLTLRTNHKDEEILINRATLFVMCNDVPTISPCDAAVEDRQGGVFEKQVRFVKRPNPFRPDHEKNIDRGLKGLFQSSADYQAAFLSILMDAYQVYKKEGHAIPKSVSAAVGEWVISETGLKGLLDMAYDTVLDKGTQRPSTSCWVTFEELRQDLLVKGVGPKNLKLGFSDAKLGKELEVLGYCKATKGAKTCKGKKTTVAVRCGLQKKDPDDMGPMLTVIGSDGAEDRAAGDKPTSEQRDTKDDAL